jgi:hypothetical protein
MKDTSARDVPGWLGAAIIAVVLFAVPLPESLVEQFYSRSAFRWWQAGVTSLSNLAPFAVLDMFILGVTVFVVLRAMKLMRSARDTSVVGALWEGARRLVRAVAVAALLFLLMWGFNYRRVPLDRTVPPARQLTVEDLKVAVSDAGALATRLRPSPKGDYPTFGDVTDWLRAPLDDALGRLKRPGLQTAGLPKYSLILTPFFTWAGVDGMVNPFALETIVHPDLLPFERPFAVAHEWAHLAGAADEADASAIGWLACMRGRPELAYSASLYLIVEAGSALPRPVWQDVASRLDPGIRADLDALAERQARQRPRIQRTAFRVYDSYLRANHVDDGVASYSRALSLILSPPMREALSGYRVDRDPRP